MFPVERVKRAEGPVIKQNVYIAGGGEPLEFLSFPSLEETGIVKHMFTTRLGGVSRGEFSTMNLSFTRGDDGDCVAENYRRIGEALSCSPRDMVASHQTHTTNIRRVTAEDKGKGITCPRDYENVDGLITDVPGVALVTYFADCVPLFLVDTVHRAIGLAHSGWRGTAGGMGTMLVKAMGQAYGTNPKDIMAAIGPSICPECYEVGGEVAERFLQFSGVVSKCAAPGKYRLDLWEANRQNLLKAGVPRGNIAVTDICTCCNDRYLFSHRASQGRRGNMAAVLCLV